MWSRIDRDRVFAEPEINRILTDHHRFGDYALLRRCLCDLGLVSRTRDGREYRRVEQAPPPEALHLIRQLKPRLPVAAGSRRGSR